MNNTTRSPRAHRHLRRIVALIAAVAATTLAVGFDSGNASAMSISQWRGQCSRSGGNWDSYLFNGGRVYECTWVTDSGYSYDRYTSRGRLDRVCGGGGFRGREVCIDV